MTNKGQVAVNLSVWICTAFALPPGASLCLQETQSVGWVILHECSLFFGCGIQTWDVVLWVNWWTSRQITFRQDETQEKESMILPVPFLFLLTESHGPLAESQAGWKARVCFWYSYCNLFSRSFCFWFPQSMCFMCAFLWTLGLAESRGVETTVRDVGVKWNGCLFFLRSHIPFRVALDHSLKQQWRPCTQITNLAMRETEWFTV